MTQVIRTENGEPVLRSDWYLEDIFSRAEELDIELTERQAVEVMGLIARTHDANIGINWEVIGVAIETVTGESA